MRKASYRGSAEEEHGSVRRVVWCSLFLTFAISFTMQVETGVAALTHSYLSGASQTLTEGVPSEFPAGSGQHPERPGRLGAVEGVVGTGGHVWISEHLEYPPFGTRVDQFDATNGDFSGNQLIEGAGVVFLTGGLAVGDTSGEEKVYVGGSVEGRSVVAVYGASSDALQATWKGANTANGSFTEAGGKAVAALDGIATDESFDPATKGDVLVATRSFTASTPTFSAVDVFAAPTGATEPPVIGELKGTCKTHGLCSAEEVVPFVEPESVAVSGYNGDVLVLDGNLDLCLQGKGECSVDVFEPTGIAGQYEFGFKIAGTSEAAPFRLPVSVSVNASNGLIYVAERATNTVDEFSATGKLEGELTGTPTGREGSLRPFQGLLSAGVDPSSGDVVVGDYNHNRGEAIADVFGPDLVIPNVQVAPPTQLTATGATLHGVIDPLGAGEAECLFEYGTSAGYGQSARCVPTSVPNGSGGVEVASSPLSKLAPGTVYHYRVTATNGNGTNTGQCPVDCGEFTTSGPRIATTSVSDVTATSAKLRGALDRHGLPTRYYFQYSATNTESCDARPEGCATMPAAPGARVGPGESVQEVGPQEIQGLSPGSVYHYRLVVASELQAGTLQEFAGPDQSFTTQASAPVRELPDGRSWQLVSPVDKEGALLPGITLKGLLQASVEGNRLAYVGTRPTEDGAAGYFDFEQILSTRGPTGEWQSEDISVPHASAVGAVAGRPAEYPFFSEDLRTSVLAPQGAFTSLAPCVAPADAERTIYLRRAETACGGRLGMFQPLVTAENVPPGTKFGGPATKNSSEVKFAGATPDLSHVVVYSNVPLALPPHSGEKAARVLYEWSADASATALLETISIKPDGTLASVGALGDQNVIARHAISVDGSRVIWADEASGNLYERNVPDKQTVQLDVPEAGCKACGGSASAVFQDASLDGSTVFFTDRQRLTEDAGEAPGRADLYVCELVEEAGKPRCKLTDLTPAVVGSGEGADVQGSVLGTSRDGAVVYFVANGVLASGASEGSCHENKPPEGAVCNLYAVHRSGATWEAPELVTTLGGGDWPTWDGEADGALSALTARVSENGRFVAFMSERSLTGYDNRDAITGKPDQEVFLYDSTTGKLGCASCNPTGARPLGVRFEKIREGIAGLSDKRLWVDGQGIAASVPGWAPFAGASALHQPRYLSDQGRLFFDSSDRLVSQDVNNSQDVYEFEPVGLNCTVASPTFSVSADGCVALISSGEASEEAGFVDASESGDDVFFLTNERLVPQDVDTARDMYDAHVCSASAPCFSQTAERKSCTEADVCRGPSTEPTGALGPPVASLLSGDGNLTFAAPTRLKVETRGRKLALALKACRKAKHRRVACERAARRRYGLERTKHGGKG